MPSEIMIALLSLLGTLIGSGLGVLTQARLTNYRIEQLEKKVDAHNNLVERTAVIERDLQTAWKRIDELK